MTNLILPGVPLNGVSGQGINHHIGAVTSTVRTNKAMPLESLKASVSGILPSFSRFESYQIFSTDERRVKVLTGERTARAKKGANFSKELKRRPEVRTGFQRTTTRPCRCKARAKKVSSAQKRRSLKPPVA